VAASKTFEVKFLGDTSGLTRSFKDIEKHGKAVGNTFGGITQSISNSMMTTGKSLTRNVTVPLAAVGAAIFKTTQAASGLAEAQSKVTAVFADQAKEVLDWGKTTATSLGISSRAALGAAGTYGNLFQAFGIGRKESQKMSMELVELAADMASFNDVPIDDALNALRSGLSGETEPLKRFGVALNDVRLKEEALRLGLISTTKGTLPIAAKAQAAYALILKDTALQQGDVARTSGGLAAQQKFLSAQVEDATAAIGQVFTPVLINLIGVVRGQLLPQVDRFVKALQSLSPEALATAIKVGLIAAAIGPALIAISYMIKGLQALATAITFVTKRVILIPTIIALLVASFVKSQDATMSWGEAFYITIRNIVKLFAGLADAVISSINFIIRAINGLTSGWNSLTKKAHDVGKALGLNNSTYKETGSAISEISFRAGGLVNSIDSAYKSFKDFGAELAAQSGDLNVMAAEAKKLGEEMANAGTNVDKSGKKTAKALKDMGEAAKRSEALVNAFTDALANANSVLDSARDAYKNFKATVSSAISGVLNFGSAQSSSAESIENARKAQDDLSKAQKAYDDSLKTDNIEAQQTALENLQAAQTAATNSITQKKSFIQVLQDQAALAASFAGKVQTLITMGLSESAIGQVLAAGADAGSAIADEIIAGGATVVDQVNTLTSATQSVADAIGESAATQFYEAGVTAGQSLVDGVRAAIAAAGLVVSATGVVSTPAPVVDQGAIDQVNAAIAKAKTKKSPGKKKITKGEREDIMALAASLGVTVPAFAKGGIVTGPTLALIGEAGPEAVIPLSGRNKGMGSTYNITVNAGLGSNGANIGREIVDVIKRYERTSGPVFASA
jgi:hypothetical protein